MSRMVKEIVLHQLVKVEENETIQLTTQLRDQVLPITQAVEDMVLTLHQNYQSKGKAYGIFLEDSKFAPQLNQWLEGEQDFLPFSCFAAELLTNELGKYPFAHGGTFILCKYNFLATDYLFIALLDSRISMLVDDKLDIQEIHYLDITQFDIACRINLSELQTNSQSNRYLTFVKGRVGRKISDFFMDFLGAEEGLNPKTQNQCLLQAVNDYCEQADLTKTESQGVKTKVFEYCNDQLKSGDEIELKELSDVLPKLNEQSFVDFTNQEDYSLDESIPPVRSTLKNLTKYSGSGKGITLSFDASLLNQRIFWDKEKDCLTINGLPPNLRDQLEKQSNE